jgi:dinuclear metal center YbgI/SA1388 family protein
MARLADMLAHLDDLLNPERYRDYGPNGLQVPGPDETEVVVTGVSAHAELFERAAEIGAGLVLTHHGILWDRAPRRIDAPMRRRLKLLLDHDMALASYHLPLDGDLELGNAVLLARALGARAEEPFGDHDGATVGAIARFDEPVARGELFARVERACGQAPLAFPAGPDPVRTLGIVTGAGADYLMEAAARGLDAFLTGEPAERAMAEARERGVTFVAAGHYATETFGIRRCGDLLAEAFGVRHEFVSVPNPI